MLHNIFEFKDVTRPIVSFERMKDRIREARGGARRLGCKA